MQCLDNASEKQTCQKASEQARDGLCLRENKREVNASSSHRCGESIMHDVAPETVTDTVKERDSELTRERES